MFFQGAGLRVGAVHHRDVAAMLDLAASQQAQDFARRPQTLFFLIVCLVQGDLRASAQSCPQTFLFAQAIALHHILGGIEDILG